MINLIFQNPDMKLIAFLGLMAAFIGTCFSMHKFSGVLPRDMGRDFAHDGKLSAGKPRGAGFSVYYCIFDYSSSVLQAQHRNGCILNSRGGGNGDRIFG